MEALGLFLMVFVLAFLIFACFVIYFIFKQLEFVIRAINLYEKMVNRQDAIIKLLMQLRGSASGHDGQDDVSLADLGLEKEDGERARAPARPSKPVGPCAKCGDSIEDIHNRSFCKKCSKYFHVKCVRWNLTCPLCKSKVDHRPALRAE